MTASSIVQEPTIGDLRAEIARLVVAVTGSWPGEQVFNDRQHLHQLVDDAAKTVHSVTWTRDRRVTEVAALRAGEDTTPVEDGAVPTVGQLWHRLLEAGLDERLRLLNIVINQRAEASRCFEQDHKGQIAELKDQLAEARTLAAQHNGGPR